MKTFLLKKRKTKLGKWLLLFGLVFFSAHSFAQIQCPPNIGFENGDLTNWETLISSDATTCGSVGNPGTAPGTSNCSNPPSVSNPFDPLVACVSLGMNTQITTFKRVMVVPNPNVPNIDPYSGLPVVCPFMTGVNNYSVKLGDTLVLDSAETLRTQFVVTVPMALTYRYAAVMQNPSAHDNCQQPRLEFNIYDLGPVGNLYPNKIKDTCASIFIPTPDAANLPSGWFAAPNNTTGSAISCSSWLPVTINLVHLVNHEVELEFSTGDCSQGGHFGYAYIDLECGTFQIVNHYCPGDNFATMYAPKGFLNYIWDTIGTGPPYIAQGQDSLFLTNINTHDTMIYDVTIFPSSSACAVDIYDTLRPVPKPTSIFVTSPNPACVGYPVLMVDRSESHYAPEKIDKWKWHFGDTISHWLDSSILQNPTHTFGKVGTYYVHLNVGTSFQCPSTELVLPVNVEQPNIHLLDSVQACASGGFHVNFYNDTTIIAAHWFAKNDVGSLSCSDCLDPVYSTPKSNWVYVFFTDKHGCTNTDSIYVDLVHCPEIVVPSAFSPNGNEQNRYFFLSDRDFVTLNTFEVYNRWGEMVYSTHDLKAQGWDGTFNGKPQPVETYVFHVVATDRNGMIKTKRGNVTLIR